MIKLTRCLLYPRSDPLNLYEITIKPTSGFVTPLKGDTIFGHFCWQAAHDPDLLDGGLEKHIRTYAEKPFAVFSSAFPKLTQPAPRYVLKCPDMPLSRLFPSQEKDRREKHKSIKEKKKRKWMIVEENLYLDLSKQHFLNDKELFEEVMKDVPEEETRRSGHSKCLSAGFSQPHNRINRLTGTTGKEPFAPYSQEVIYYYPGMELAVFVLIDESAAAVEKIHCAMKKIGRWGYGKDASVGMGKFDVTGDKALTLPNAAEANACYTLAPCVPDKGRFDISNRFTEVQLMTVARISARIVF